MLQELVARTGITLVLAATTWAVHASDAVAGQESRAAEIILDFDGELADDGVPKPWTLSERDGSAEFRIVERDEQNDEKVLYLRSNNASFSLDRKVTIPVRKYRWLRWSWKAEELPKGGDVRDKKKNDQALQILVGFPGNKVISYIWDSTAPLKTLEEESYVFGTYQVRTVVVTSSDDQLGEWVTITRNVYKDYKKFYDEDPPKEIKVIKVQTNSQYTKSVGAGYVSKLVFSSGVNKKPEGDHD